MRWEQQSPVPLVANVFGNWLQHPTQSLDSDTWSSREEEGEGVRWMGDDLSEVRRQLV